MKTDETRLDDIGPQEATIEVTDDSNDNQADLIEPIQPRGANQFVGLLEDWKASYRQLNPKVVEWRGTAYKLWRRLSVHLGIMPRGLSPSSVRRHLKSIKQSKKPYPLKCFGTGRKIVWIIPLSTPEATPTTGAAV
ncbi:MAG: hypothetical protein U1F98_13340 [Verrucomicrobiota bacterium]